MIPLPVRAAVVAPFLFACAGKDFESHERDAGVDAGSDSGGFEPTAPADPEPPQLTPCPEGWREVPPAEDSGIAVCEPFPADGPADCAPDEAHFPGTAGCSVVGTPCPEGDFAEDLPAGETIVYVRVGAVGGDGSEALPYGSIGEAIAEAPAAAILALAKGTYDEHVVLTRSLVLRGACVAETIVASSTPSASAATVTVNFGQSRIENLTVGGQRLGIQVASAGPVELDSVVVDGAVGVGVDAWGGALVVANSLVVRGTRLLGGNFGYGLNVQTGAHVEVSRALFDANHSSGIFVANPGSELIASDVVVRDTLDHAGGDAGYGLSVLGGARADFARALFERNRTATIFVIDAGSELVASDLVVRDTLARPGDGGNGDGLAVQFGARAEIARALFERDREAEILATESGTELVLSDVVVRDALQREIDGAAGLGLYLDRGASAQVQRLVVERGRALGIALFAAGTVLEASDISVRDTRPDAAADDFGYGLYVDGARATVVRGTFVGNRGFGALSGAAASLVLEDVRIEGTLASPCAESGACEGFGTGVAAFASATVSATRFAVSNHFLCGVQLATGGQIDLHDGLVSGNAIGVNVQTEGFDLARLQDRVRFVDNQRDLDSASLPVPGPIEGI